MTVKLIKTYRIKKFKNIKGEIIKYVSKKDKYFKNFGEVYFNIIKKNQTKGWNLHKKNTCLVMCLVGKVRLHLIDLKNKEFKIVLSSTSKKIIKIPPKVWFSFKSLNVDSMIVNLINDIHSDNEVQKNIKVKSYLIK